MIKGGNTDAHGKENMMNNIKETMAMLPSKDGYDDGYSEGYVDGFSKGKEDGYADGCEYGAEALRTALLKALHPLDYDLPIEFLKGVYKHNIDCFLSNNTAEDIINLVDEEEKKYKGIKVGDEVIFSGKTGVVTNTEFTLGDKHFFCDVVDEDGKTMCKFESDLEKTGRHFPEIEKVLKTLKESD